MKHGTGLRLIPEISLVQGLVKYKAHLHQLPLSMAPAALSGRLMAVMHESGAQGRRRAQLCPLLSLPRQPHQLQLVTQAELCAAYGQLHAVLDESLITMDVWPPGLQGILSNATVLVTYSMRDLAQKELAGGMWHIIPHDGSVRSEMKHRQTELLRNFSPARSTNTDQDVNYALRCHLL